MLMINIVILLRMERAIFVYLGRILPMGSYRTNPQVRHMAVYDVALFQYWDMWVQMNVG